MNTKTYIESGVLESYILGSLSPEETKEVQKMAAQYPEIQAELDSIEMVLADFAQSQAVTPPSYMKTQILQTIENLSTTTPKIITTPTVANNSRLLAAAIGVLMIVKLVTILYFYQKSEEFKERSKELQNQIAKLENSSNQTQNRLKNLEEKMQIIQDENIKSIILKNKEQERKANVYWKEGGPIAYIDAIDVADPKEGQEYQLWAIKGNTLTNLGAVAIHEIKPDELLEIELTTTDFDAFAISLEEINSHHVAPQSPPEMSGKI